MNSDPVRMLDRAPLHSNISLSTIVWRRVTHSFPHIYHGESSAADRRVDVGDAKGGISARSGGNAVSNDLYRETTGNRVTVGGITTYI